MSLTSLADSRRVWFFPYTGALVICMGLYLHVSRLALGLETFVTQVFTSSFDLMLFVPMVFTAIGMIVFRSQVHHPARWRAIVYRVIMVYFCVSVPIHLRAQLTQSIDFVSISPWWYSVMLMPWLVVQLYVFLTITVNPSPARDRLAH